MTVHHVYKVCTLLLMLGLTSSCSTNFLSKYSQKNRASQRNGSQSKSAQVQKKLNRGAIIPLDANTFRFHQPFANVWNSALDILLENYNLTIVDRKSGIITTEWDSFYIGEVVFRNKLSLRLKKISFNMVDVTVHNSVETWKSIGDNGLQAAWLPADRGHDEMARVIKNMAIAMNLPKPIIPREVVARGNPNKNP